MAKQDGILVGIEASSGDPKIISQVVSGKACGCVCPECRIPLIAKKGEQISHHFAHSSLPDSLLSCQETALHLAAKTLIALEVSSIQVPKREQRFSSTVRYINDEGLLVAEKHSVTTPANLLERLSGRVEPGVPEISPYRPDAQISTSIGDLFIEVRVTHQVDAPKQRAMQKADLAVLELDLSKAPRTGLTLDELYDWVVNRAPRAWVSKGLAGQVAEALPAIDRAIKAKEDAANRAMLGELVQFAPRSLVYNAQIASVQFHSPGEDFEVPFWPPRNLTLSHPRYEKGFMLADLPGANGALITNSDNRQLIRRLFAWHQSVKDKPLTVLSIADPPTLYANSLDAVNQIVSTLLGPSAELEHQVDSAMVIGRFIRPQPLSVPITSATIAPYLDRTFIGSGLPGELVSSLIANGLFDLVVTVAEETARSYLSGERLARAYMTNELFERFTKVRRSGSPQEDLLGRIETNHPCVVRFVPSVASRLKGNLFNRLIADRGSVFFEDECVGRHRVYFDRSEFWNKGGLLILPDPMRRGDYHLEASKAFMDALRGNRE